MDFASEVKNIEFTTSYSMWRSSEGLDPWLHYATLIICGDYYSVPEYTDSEVIENVGWMVSELEKQWNLLHKIDACPHNARAS